MYGILTNSTAVLGALAPGVYKNCPGQPTCPRWNGCVSTATNGGVFRLSCATDYNGLIIGTAQANFFVDCADACSRRTGCTAFNMKDNFCYLLGMDVGVPRVSNNDVNAGTQVKPATELEPTPGSSTCDATINCPNDDYCRYKASNKSYITRCNYDYYGGDIALGPTGSLADCANRCSIFEGCVAATWVSGMCYLKNSDYKVVYNAFVDSVYLED